MKDPAKEFCRLCREGRLFETEAWLKAGKPSAYEHKNIRCTPLGIAIERGFHSLVEVLLRHGLAPTPKHLAFAVRKGHTGIVQLLLQHGAIVQWLHFGFFKYYPQPEILKLFLEGGLDTEAGYPIAEILKTAPRAFLGIYRTYVGRFPGWKFQADMALRHFCGRGAMGSVCLLLWLGADPRAKVPMEADEDKDVWASGLWEACANGHLEIVKKIEPSKERDDLDELLRVAACFMHADIVGYLLSLGADPNSASEHGETALREALCGLGWRFGLGSPGPSSGIETVKCLVAAGARLDPGNREQVSFLRLCLQKLYPTDACELVRFLHAHQGADRSVLLEILKTPKARERLGTRLRSLTRIFPELKKFIHRTPQTNGL